MRERGPGVAKTSIATELDPDETGPAVRLVLRELDALLARHAGLERRAAMRWSSRGGEAQWIHAHDDDSAEILRIRWNDCEIESIDIESGDHLSFESPAAPDDTAKVVDTVLPLLWRHIRHGRPLPVGIERFAGFLSLR
jgi:hypothetical protein